MRNKIISEFLKKYGTNYLWGAIFLLLCAFIETLSPKYLGIIIDLLGAPVIEPRQVMKYIGFILLATLATFVTRFIWRYFIMGNAR